jgi:amino acid transporter/mannitol/fructose-specific phosphotransferase system IIA component (Ntr-type)
MADGEDQKLSKELKLFDVFAISTGAMFSSGFFLLPGLAAAEAGPSVVLAYLIAGVLMLPAMLSMAELSTAMPRAGGAYYFLDRALGPVVGTVGGVGTWIALILKSAFGLIGMGAYLALFFDVPVTQLALVLTLVFTIVNIVGAKETSQLQRWLVVILLSVLFFFLVQGFVEIVSLGPGVVRESQFSPLMPFGVTGLFSTVGLVFVSYAGLTKVASVAEEIQDPDVNIPLGMTLSLIVATAAYVLGVVVIVAVLEPNALHEDLTPVATAARSFFDWLPGSTGVVLVVAAAIAAFASTANAGIMSASRYLFAMGRDKVVSPGFSRIGRFKTPTRAVWATGVLMALVLVSLDVMSVAKLASAFQLFIFSLLNLAVIVLRESRIEGYDPGYRSPFYPWVQGAGVLIPLWLITQMGGLTILFTFALTGVALWWYFYYAKGHMTREGAVLHLFERLGRQRDFGLERELREVLLESDRGGHDPFSELVAESLVIDLEYETIVWRVAARLTAEFGIPSDDVAEAILTESRVGLTPVANRVALPHVKLPNVRTFHLVLVRTPEDVRLSVEGGKGSEPVRALFFLVSPEARHLGFLASLAGRMDDDKFIFDWTSAETEQELKEAVLHEERFLSLEIRGEGPTEELADREVREIALVEGALIALVHRSGTVVIPRGRTRLESGDRLTHDRR